MQFSPCNSHCNHNLFGRPSPFPSHSSAILMADYSWKEKERELSNLYPFFQIIRRNFQLKIGVYLILLCWMIHQNKSAFFSSLQIETGFLPMCWYIDILIANGELHVNLCSCSHHWYEGGDNMAISDVKWFDGGVILSQVTRHHHYSVFEFVVILLTSYHCNRYGKQNPG